MTRVDQALQAARRRLADLPDTDPQLDAQVLLAHLLDKERSWLYAWSDAELTDEQQAAYEALIQRRASGEPVAHITGRREFWGLDLTVSPDTLIPRPDTELLVEAALELGAAEQSIDVLDLGTGSGAIAIALATERPHWLITATDLSESALSVARTNAEQLGLTQVEFLTGHWFDAIEADRHFDLILSNPPYIPQQDPHLRQGDVRFEPRSALAAGSDGLDDLRLLAAQAPTYLKPGGWLFLEHGYDQGTQVRQLFEQAGYRRIQTRRDLAGRDRVTLGHH